MAGVATASEIGASRQRVFDSADSRRAALVGNRTALGGHSIGNDAAVGAGFSSRESRGPRQQYPSADPDRTDRPARIPRVSYHLRLVAARDGDRESARILRGIVARNRGVVQPSAARFLPHSRVPNLARHRVFARVCSSRGSCACGCGTPNDSCGAAAPAATYRSHGVGGSRNSGGVCRFSMASHPFAPHLERGKLEADVLDVGQGDSIFAAFPGPHDADRRRGAASPSGSADTARASDAGEEVVSPYLWSRGIKRLDANPYSCPGKARGDAPEHGWVEGYPLDGGRRP